MAQHGAFFYGTLMVPHILYRVCFETKTPTESQQSRLKIQPAILHNYCRRKVIERDYPALTFSPGDSVRGTYVHGLSDEDIRRMDIWEGAEYERRSVKINLLEIVGDEIGQGNVEGNEIQAETYVWNDAEDRLEHGEWDFAHFQREKMHRWTDDDEEYEELDYLTSSTSEDSTGGRGAGGRITKQLADQQDKEVLESAI